MLKVIIILMVLIMIGAGSYYMLMLNKAEIPAEIPTVPEVEEPVPMPKSKTFTGIVKEDFCFDKGFKNKVMHEFTQPGKINKISFIGTAKDQGWGNTTVLKIQVVDSENNELFAEDFNPVIPRSNHNVNCNTINNLKDYNPADIIPENLMVDVGSKVILIIKGESGHRTFIGTSSKLDIDFQPNEGFANVESYSSKENFSNY